MGKSKIKNDELLDLVNEKDEVIGTVWKSEAHKDPAKIHREVGVLILTKFQEVLVHQRSVNMNHGPGEWQFGVAGHVNAGEKPIDAAKREVEEEVGISNIKLKYSCKFFDQYQRQSRIFRVYYAILSKKSIIKIDKNEVEQFQWIKLSKLEDFVNNHHSHAIDRSWELLQKVIKTSKILSL